MIFDKMERLTQYKGLNANLDALIDFTLTHTFDSLVPGKNGIDGDRTPLDLVPGTFAIFFPGDAHNCGLPKGDTIRVRKLVGKARI